MNEKADGKGDASPYAGRWVGRVRGRIVGQGGTPAAAGQAGAGSRPKERVEVSFVPPDPPIELPRLVEQIASITKGETLYLVGGGVRDLLRGREFHDFDFAVARDAIGLARRVARALGADIYVLDEEFDAARVIAAGPDGSRDVLDFTSFRGADIIADLKARDFTINAMALDMTQWSILDPLHGGADLRSRLIRQCAAGALREDPIRILRGVRLAAALDFQIEPSTRAAMRQLAHGLAATSRERQRDEIFKMLDGPRPDASLRALEMLEALPQVMPELAALKHVGQPAPHTRDVWEHTLSVVRHLGETLRLLLADAKPDESGGMLASRLMLGLGRYRPQLGLHYSQNMTVDRTARSLLLFAALYHDVGKPITRSTDDDGRVRFLEHESIGAGLAAMRCRQFNLSIRETAKIRAIVFGHLRFGMLARRMESDEVPPSRRAIYRFFRDAGDCGPDLVLLGLADLKGARGHNLTEQAWSTWVGVARVMLENLWEKPSETVAPPRLLDGTELMRECELEPGPPVGELLEAIREAQATGQVLNREQALRFAREWIRLGGLRDR